MHPPLWHLPIELSAAEQVIVSRIRLKSQTINQQEPEQEIPLGSLWFSTENQQWHRWSERWLVIRSHALAMRQIKGLQQRLQKAEAALASPCLPASPRLPVWSVPCLTTRLIQQPL
ncbi:MAG: hypothetical protein RLP02_05270 [Coleofasciculus sp. C2-GNP5-27]